MGFVAFPMPEVFPRHYWLFHSIWHVCLAAGYYELYALIEQDSHKGQTVQRANQKSIAEMKKKDLSTMHNVASNSSLESSSELATLKHRVAPQVWSHAMHTNSFTMSQAEHYGVFFAMTCLFASEHAHIPLWQQFCGIHASLCACRPFRLSSAADFQTIL